MSATALSRLSESAVQICSLTNSAVTKVLYQKAALDQLAKTSTFPGSLDEITIACETKWSCNDTTQSIIL